MSNPREIVARVLADGNPEQQPSVDVLAAEILEALVMAGYVVELESVLNETIGL